VTSQAVRIRRNYFYSVLSISSRLISNVIVFWIIARFYGPVLFGQFAFAQTLATIFIISADFGFDILLTNEVARNRDKALQYFQQYFTLKLIFTLVSMAGMCSFAIFNSFSSYATTLIVIFSLYMVFTTLTNFLFALYKGFEKLEYETKVSLFINGALLICVLVLLFIKVDILYVAYTFAITRMLGFVLGIKYTSIILKSIRFRPQLPKFREERSKILVYGLHLVFSYLFFQLDTILLALWKSDYDVGIYQSVFKIILIFLTLPEIFVNTLLPVLSRLNVENHLQWERVGFLMNKLLFIVIIPISLILFVFADRIIILIYGTQNYQDAITILRIFSVILFVRFNLETYALMLTTANRQKIRMYVVIIASVLNICLNYFAIPKYGAYGAAIVSLITNTVVGIIYIASTLPLFYKWMINVRMISLLIIALIVALVIWSFNSMVLFYISPVLAGVYLLLAYNFLLSEEEIQLIFPDRLRFPRINFR
jgi:O-antigen/teichoic acid export membrane protein